jgi:hypothetical protein
MTSPEILYAFCRNVHCSLHALFLASDPNANADLKVGELCPICGAEQIASVVINAIATLLRASGNSTPTGTVLTALPYGGMVLQRGDDDATGTWGGVKVSDPRHSGAQYVAELQMDLVKLAYYGPARSGETVGKFGLQLMASVLNVKQHMVKYLGTPANPNFDEVQAAAKNRSEGPAASATPDPADRLAIYYPKDDVPSPADALGDINAWSKHLGETSSRVPLLASVQSWIVQWDKLQAKGMPAPDELDKLREQTRDDSSLRETLSGKKAAKTAAANAYSTKVSTLEYPYKSGTLTEAAVAEAESTLDNLVTTLNAVGDPLPELLARLRTLDARLPNPAKLPDPGNQQVTLVPEAPSDQSLDARYRRLKDANQKQSSVRAAQDTALSFAKGKLGTFTKRIDDVGKLWGDCDAKGALILSSVQTLKEQSRVGASNAELLNQQLSTGKPSTSYQLATARSRTQHWVKTTIETSSAGSLEQLETVINETESRWGTQSVSCPGPDWSNVKNALGDIRVNLANYHAEIEKTSAETWETAYLSLLRDFGRVDLATARYIRSMATQGTVHETIKVFRVPQDAEVIRMQNSVLSELPRIMDTALPRIKRAAKDGPLPIVRFIYRHESGAAHTFKYGGHDIVKVGVDWKDPDTANAFFSEKNTPAKQLSMSRGWGATQFTTGEAIPESRFPDVNGNLKDYTFHAGIPFSSPGDTEAPMPAFVASVEGNVLAGTTRFLQGFPPSGKRECCFQPGTAPTSGHSYKCCQCAMKLNPGVAHAAGGGVKAFDDSGDFVRLPGGKNLYRLRSLERLRELLTHDANTTDGFFQLPDGRGSDEATEADLNEFPCSWLACIIRFAGVSPRGFNYMLEGIETLRNPKNQSVLDPP